MRLLRRWCRLALDYLPQGNSLPDEAWRVRHRTLTYLLRAHVVAVFVLALALGKGPAHSAEEAAVIGAFALASWAARGRRILASAVTALGLMVSSAVLVHVTDGTIEMHFHFFVMVGILTLYQDWVPFLTAIGFVVVHHGVLGTLASSAVYNHPSAVAHPVRWALIHGGFVLASSAASVVAWKRVEEQALCDALTGLPNRRLFDDRLRQAAARTTRQTTTLGVIYVDLDGFKRVNDTLGHAGGDQLLVLVAQRLRGVLRPSDTAARMGGDEFALLLEDLDGDAEAEHVAQRLLDSLSAPFVVRGIAVTIGASAGIARKEPGMSVDEVLLRADRAMYDAKAAGRGCVRVAHQQASTPVPAGPPTELPS